MKSVLELVGVTIGAIVVILLSPLIALSLPLIIHGGKEK